MTKIISRLKDWKKVCDEIRSMVAEPNPQLNQGQHESLISISYRLRNNGMVIADEVGLGKTRIAVAVAKAVIKNGGRVAVLIPPGLG